MSPSVASADSWQSRYDSAGKYYEAIFISLGKDSNIMLRVACSAAQKQNDFSIRYWSDTHGIVSGFGFWKQETLKIYDESGMSIVWPIKSQGPAGINLANGSALFGKIFKAKNLHISFTNSANKKEVLSIPGPRLKSLSDFNRAGCLKI